jgi:putative DNA primase/helicase
MLPHDTAPPNIPSEPHDRSACLRSGINMGEAALWYVKQGIPIFPLHNPEGGGCSCAKADCEHVGKHPRTPHGFKDATTDLSQIMEWWDRHPSANIGIPTGVASRLLVVDCDPRNGGPAERSELAQRFGPIPDTAEVMTGGGGRHFFFRYEGGSVPKALAEGIDLKGDGGYVVAPPSLHPSGKRYEVDGLSGPKALLKPAEVPAWLRKQISASQNSTGAESSGDSKKWGTGERNNNLVSVAGSMRRRGLSREAIEAALLEENGLRCEPPLPVGEVRRIAQSVARYEPARAECLTLAETPDHWPKPRPIQSELPPVQPFSEDLLPETLRPLAADVAERMQVPMDFPAVVNVIDLAGAVNRRAVIQPRARDTSWEVVPNLWGAIIAEPGFLKSPVIQTLTRPLNQIDAEWWQLHEQALKEYTREKEEYDLRLVAWKAQYKRALNKIGATLPNKPGDEPEKPKLRRLIVNDATFEALHLAMSENPAGILAIRDELSGWWSLLDRKGREGERGFCLEAWNGNSGFTVDRIGRGTIRVPHCCMSMLGGIQPGRLRSYLVEAVKDGPSNDGLIQRFQLLVWPDIAPDWKYVDRAPNDSLEQKVASVFRKLLEMDPKTPARFRFAPDAQELFIEWLAGLEAKVRGNQLHPALVSHLSKYRSLMPSLGLLFELAAQAASDGFDGCALAYSQNFVSLDHAKQAAAWCEYLESHARRVYSCTEAPKLKAARDLAEKIKRREIRNKEHGSDWFSARDVYINGWTGLNNSEAVRSAAEVLQDAGWLRLVNVDDTGGRNALRYVINPRVWE